MTKDNIIIELLDLLRKTYTKQELVSALINNGFMENDFYKIPFNYFNLQDIKDGIKHNFKGK